MTTALSSTGLALDHLVVAASTLEQGVRWCEAVLGVIPGPGGRHAFMGTHNRLLKLHGSGLERAYLEIIAIDPQAPSPARARWFGLDQRDPAAPPALVHWVLRCEDLPQRRAALREWGFDPGAPEAASRSTPHGELHWRISLRDDGQPLAGGALPTLIQWEGEHPTVRMAGSGIALQGFCVGPLPDAVRTLIQVPQLQVRQQPGLQAALLTPRGHILLTSPSPSALSAAAHPAAKTPPP